MPLFNYNKDIPFATHNPSNDQPKMQVNTNSTDLLINHDHYSFNFALGGTHKQVNFSTELPQGAQVEPASVLFTAQGTVTKKAELEFRNENRIFPVSLIKAFCVFDKDNSIPTVASNISSFNVDSILGATTTTVTIKITAGALGPLNSAFGVLATNKQGSALSWSYVSPNLTVNCGTAGATTVTVLLLQF